MAGIPIKRRDVVWDLEGRELIDMSIMGIGPTLGYGHPEVDAAVMSTIVRKYEHFKLPESLIGRKIDRNASWAEMARFARSGGSKCNCG